MSKRAFHAATEALYGGEDGDDVENEEGSRDEEEDDAGLAGFEDSIEDCNDDLVGGSMASLGIGRGEALSFIDDGIMYTHDVSYGQHLLLLSSQRLCRGALLDQRAVRERSFLHGAVDTIHIY